VKWLIEDYSKVPSHLIEQSSFSELEALEHTDSNQQMQIDIAATPLAHESSQKELL
jgi:BCCT family betaine/carnitine transporter